jgi:hypothetical protein
MTNINKTNEIAVFCEATLAGSCRFDRERVENPHIKWHTADTAPFAACSWVRA